MIFAICVLFGAVLYGCGLPFVTDTPPPHTAAREEVKGMANMDHAHHHSHGATAAHTDPFGGPYKSMGADCGGWILCPASSPHDGDK
ncbi:MAG: hypothetical protein HYT94_01880 [Parcubacteria group bacterium]|nr:hypothetical protein [Parcubacteria group bacterium]